MTSRALPVLDIAPPVTGPAGPRGPLAPADERLEQFRPDLRSLPSFFVWTLGCQMNKSDSEEMAGRLLAAGCAEAAAMDVADLVVINTCAIREAAEAKVIGRQGHLKRLKAANPGLRVVMTGCSVRESNRAGLARRYPAIDVFLRPDEEPELIDRLGLASAQAPVGATAATTLVHGAPVSDATHLVRARADAIAGGAVSRGSAISAWLPIIYGCDKTCTYCIVPFSRGPERSRPFDEIVDEARALATAGFREVTLLGQNVNSYGHDLAPEPRFGHIHTARTVGRRQDREGRPDLAELIRAIDGLRTTDGTPAIPRLRFVTSHPWDLSDRLIEAMAECPSMCEALHLPVQSGSDAMLRRMGRQYTVEHYEERLARIREAVPGIALSTDVIVGFCGETEAEYEATLRLLETVHYDQVFAAAYSERPGTPATRMADDVPAAVKRARLNGLLALQEGIGLERNRAWMGRTTEVLVDTIVPPKHHEHEDDEAAGTAESRDAFARLPDGLVHLAGRSRENKLVHVAGSAALVGHPVRVRIEHAGPYALRGERGLTLAPLVVIGGPTATGKTGLAIALAERLIAGGRPAEVISADSRQVYRGLNIGTAKATDDERRRVVHHGLDLVDPDQPFSVADFRRHALEALRSLGERGGVGILAGGTGFWLRAVIAGLDTESLPSDAAVRAEIEHDLASHGLPSIAARLTATAPMLAARTDLRNPRRVVRALEIARLRGDLPLPAAVGYPAPMLGLQLLVEPGEHAQRIQSRARAQFAAGLVDEARGLRERWDPNLPAFSAIGYRESWAELDGTLTREAAIDLDARRNAAFAKRQRTWFRQEPTLAVVDATFDALRAATDSMDRFINIEGRHGTSRA